MSRNRACLIAAVLLPSLSACSNEPSESEMLQAITRFTTNLYQQQIAAISFVVGARRDKIPPAPTITAFRKLGCQPAEIGGRHACEFEVTLAGAVQTRDRARFIRVADGSLVMSVN